MCLSQTVQVQVRFSCGIGQNVLKEEFDLFIYIKFFENYSHCSVLCKYNRTQRMAQEKTLATVSEFCG